MTPTFACDVSYYQDPVDDSYPHDWFIFRSNDGEFRDPNFAKNLRWARQAATSGRITGYTVYCVFRPDQDWVGTLFAMLGAPDPHVTVMVDVEAWKNQIRGNQSARINAGIDKITVWLADRRRVLAYANAGDFANLYPNRPSWLRLVIASYGSQRPTMRNAIGWQYTNGQNDNPVPDGYPRSSKPFGRCDHNVFPGLTPAQLADALGVGSTPAPPKEFTVQKAEENKIRAIVVDVVKEENADTIAWVKETKKQLAGQLEQVHSDLQKLTALVEGMGK